jgi:hypothetical protein
MMKFYAAVGCYKIKREQDSCEPYIQSLGKLHPISIPEFVIWTTLLWDVLSYDELKELYQEQTAIIPGILMQFDELLNMLVERKLIVCGQGYTGVDALCNMLSDAFVIPYRARSWRTIGKMLAMWLKGDISTFDLFTAWKTNDVESGERTVLQLTKHTPLSTSEIAYCFENGISKVRGSQQVVAIMYDRDDVDQKTLSTALTQSEKRDEVLTAVANLYLKRKILFEVA